MHFLHRLVPRRAYLAREVSVFERVSRPPHELAPGHSLHVVLQVRVRVRARVRVRIRARARVRARVRATVRRVAPRAQSLRSPAG